MKAFRTIYLVTPWMIPFISNSESIQNRMQKLVIWNGVSSAEIPQFYWCYIDSSSTSFSALLKQEVFKFCWLEFGIAWHFNILDGTLHIKYFIFIFYPDMSQIWETSLGDNVLAYVLAKLALIAKKVSLTLKDPVSIPFICNLKHIDFCFINHSMKITCK